MYLWCDHRLHKPKLSCVLFAQLPLLDVRICFEGLCEIYKDTVAFKLSSRVRGRVTSVANTKAFFPSVNSMKILKMSSVKLILPHRLISQLPVSLPLHLHFCVPNWKFISCSPAAPKR